MHSAAVWASLVSVQLWTQHARRVWGLRTLGSRTCSILRKILPVSSGNSLSPHRGQFLSDPSGPHWIPSSPLHTPLTALTRFWFLATCSLTLWLPPFPYLSARAFPGPEDVPMPPSSPKSSHFSVPTASFLIQANIHSGWKATSASSPASSTYFLHCS